MLIVFTRHLLFQIYKVFNDYGIGFLYKLINSPKASTEIGLLLYLT